LKQQPLPAPHPVAPFGQIWVALFDVVRKAQTCHMLVFLPCQIYEVNARSPEHQQLARRMVAESVAWHLAAAVVRSCQTAPRKWHNTHEGSPSSSLVWTKVILLKNEHLDFHQALVIQVDQVVETPHFAKILRF